MQFVNRTELQASMTRNGFKIKDIAEELCVSYSCAYAKIKGIRDFNENELFIIHRLFGSSVFFLDSPAIKMRANNGNKKSNRKTD